MQEAVNRALGKIGLTDIPALKNVDPMQLELIKSQVMEFLMPELKGIIPGKDEGKSAVPKLDWIKDEDIVPTKKAKEK